MSGKLSNYQIKRGIFFIIDVVDFTPQMARLTAFQQQGIESIFNKVVDFFGTKARHIKTSGDALLMFMDAADVDEFPVLITELRTKTIDCDFDTEDFRIRIRVVAHYAQFQLEISEDGKIKDILDAEAIKNFRLEKSAKRNEVLITESLRDCLEKTFQELQLKTIRFESIRLKGLGNSINTYKIEFPQIQIESEALREKLAHLKIDCQKIPVFGNVSKPFNMGDNFINLTFKGQLKKESIEQSRYKKHESLEVQHEMEKKKELEEYRTFKVSEFYEPNKMGIIFGLPGSGKTTAMRYFAYRNFEVNENINDEKFLVTLFIQCKSIISLKEYLQKYYHNETANYKNTGRIIEYLTYCFVFENPESLTEIEKEQLESASAQVFHSFMQGRLWVLIDGFDEAKSSEIKNDLASIAKFLINENNGSSIFLTSRYSERNAYFTTENEHHYEVCSLTKEQLNDIAVFLYGRESYIFKNLVKNTGVKILLRRSVVRP
ncbi:MAG: hypothetical protein IPG01_04150 [Chitinophagaceae bacterium]|nr:hypothetical protein [Chitinophagaceae bacterium]